MTRHFYGTRVKTSVAPAFFSNLMCFFEPRVGFVRCWWMSPLYYDTLFLRPIKILIGIKRVKYTTYCTGISQFMFKELVPKSGSDAMDRCEHTGTVISLLLFFCADQCERHAREYFGLRTAVIVY